MKKNVKPEKLVPMREAGSRVIPINTGRKLTSIPPLERHLVRQPPSLAKLMGEQRISARRRRAA